jgi:hypothetical protein
MFFSIYLRNKSQISDGFSCNIFLTIISGTPQGKG